MALTAGCLLARAVRHQHRFPGRAPEQQPERGFARAGESAGCLAAQGYLTRLSLRKASSCRSCLPRAPDTDILMSQHAPSAESGGGHRAGAKYKLRVGEFLNPSDRRCMSRSRRGGARDGWCARQPGRPGKRTRAWKTDGAESGGHGGQRRADTVDAHSEASDCRRGS